MDAMIGSLMFCAFIVGYLLPSIVAVYRKHRNGNAIFIVNLLFGWTALGWALALVWSMTCNTERSVGAAA